MRWKMAVLAVAALLALSTSACGLESSETNEIGLVYTGGWFEDKEFKEILKDGATNKATGFGSKTYRYRIDQRSYRAGSAQRGADAPPVVVVSNDDVQLRTDYQLYFKLNQDEKILRRFHENLGVKTNAWTNDGWVQMLRDYFEPQIERSLEAAALQFNWRDLYASEEIRVAFQADAVLRIKQAIKEVIGDDYFCGPAYVGPKSPCGDFTMTVGKPEPARADLVAAVEAEQTAAAATIAQVQKNAVVAAELQSEQQIVALYGPQGAVERERNRILEKAIAGGKVTQIIIDNSGRRAA